MSFNRAELAQTLFEEAADALFLFDPGTESIVDVNPMAQRLCGFSRRDLLAMEIGALFRCEEQGGSSRLRNAFKKTGLFHAQDGYVLRSAKGAWIPVNLSVTRLHAEPKTLALITARDVREQRAARLQLERTESELKRVLSSVSDFVWGAEQDAQGRWQNLYYSPVVERIAGRPPAYYAIGLHRWLGAVHPEDRARVEERLLALQDGKTNQLTEEYRIVLPDGSVRWVRDSVLASYVGDGSIRRLDGVVADVTARRQAEEARRFTDQRFARVVETVADGLCILDQTGQIVFANAAAERIFGISRAEFLSRRFDDPAWQAARVDGGLLTAEDYALPRVLATRQPVYGLERAFTRPDGQRIVVSFSASPLLDAEGVVVGMVSSFTDTTERRLAEQALRESEQRFRVFMDNSPVIAFVKDDQGRYVYGNRSWARQFNQPTEALLGKTDADLWPAEAVRLFKESDDLALAAGQTVETTETSLNAMGEELSWLVLKFPMQGADGRKLLGGMVLDVTARRQAEDQDRRSRNLLRSISNVQARFIEDEDPRGIFEGLLADLLALTESTYGFIGEVHWDADGQPFLKAQAIANLSWDDHSRRLHEQVAAQGMEFRNLRTLFGHVLTTGAAVISNDPSNDVRKGGLPPGHPPLESFLGMPIHHGRELVGMVGVANRPGGYQPGLVEHLHPFLTTCASIVEACHNDRRRRQAEQALRASESKYRTLVENLQQSVFLKDAKLRFVAANDQFCRFTGIGEESLIGRCDFDFFPRPLAEKYRSDDLRVLQGERVEVEEQNQAQGKLRNVRVVKTPVRNSEGHVTGVLGIFWDVTEQRQLEAQLQQAVKMEAIGQLAGGVAHDFNNLLQAILGNLALVLPALEPGDPHRTLLQAAERASQRAAELVRQLLGFSRRTMLRLEPLDLNEGMRETVALLQRTIDPRITLAQRLDPKLWPVLADHGQMNQVLMNLFLNARDAMPEGGRLTIATDNVVVDDEYVRSCLGARHGDFVRLSVRDTGHGMPAETRVKVFEPFFTTKAKDKGTGLGLAMVHGIVEQHQGWITCQSQVNEGALFEIYLPRFATSTPAAALPMPTDPLLDRGTETILFVDDETVVRHLGQTILQRFGYRVILAEDGAEAVDVYQRERERIDLVILDLTMPRLSGRDALRELLRIDADVRVVLSSGYSAETPSPGERGAAVGFLGKPYRPEELGRLVREVLDQKQRDRPRHVATNRNGSPLTC